MESSRWGTGLSVLLVLTSPLGLPPPLAGLVLYATGSYNAILILSMAFSLGGVVVIALLDSNSHVLIPDWESELPDEAQLKSALPRSASPPPLAAAPTPAGGDGDG